jgi:hypothetical protein
LYLNFTSLKKFRKLQAEYPYPKCMRPEEAFQILNSV